MVHKLAIITVILLLASPATAWSNSLCDAARKDVRKTLRTLVEEEGVDVNAACSKDGRTALHIAAEYNQYNLTINGLAELGANLDARDESGLTALHYVAWAGRARLITALVELGADLEARNKAGGTPLHSAASKGQYESITTLVELGADLEVRDEHGRTALHYAANAGERRGHYEVLAKSVANLVELGADLDVRDERGWTALHYAAHWAASRPGVLLRGHIFEIIAALVDAGARVQTQRKGKIPTPLQLLKRDKSITMYRAAIHNATNMIEALVAVGADPDAYTRKGVPPLHYAAANGRTNAIWSLLAAGADPNRPRRGSTTTALHQAAGNGHTEAVMALALGGADLNAITADGLTADELAREQGYHGVAQAIETLRRR